MRLRFDSRKSRAVKRKHGVSLEEAQAIFDQVHVVDRKLDDPAQFRAIGWCGGKLCSVIFEVRKDAEGESYHLITAWESTEQEQRSYVENI
jgi:uncharacterized DUF497 family protein